MNQALPPYHEEEITPPVSVSHFIGVMGAYLPAIVLWMAIVGLVYGIIALTTYATAPATRTTTQPFRLDFAGAADGKYPNGSKFNPTEIVATPILLTVFESSQIAKYMNFRDFTSSVYIVGSNPEAERLQREYSLRLSDQKLSMIERQQIEKELNERLQSLDKNLLTLNFATATNAAKRVPDEVVKAALSRILFEWANWAQNEGHVTSYNVVVLSPSVLDEDMNPNGIIAIRIMIRSLAQVIDNMDQISQLPGATLVRTRKDAISLAELRLEAEGLIRFQLEPAIPMARAAQGGVDRTAVQFVQTQLDYDRRTLRSYQDRVDAIKEALALYTTQRPVSVDRTTLPKDTKENKSGTTESISSGEAVMPQVSDTFIDRMAQILNQAADVQYRQKMVDDLRRVQQDLIPTQSAVRYDEELLAQLSIPSTAAPGGSVQQLQDLLIRTRARAKEILMKVNEIYEITSRNISPQNALYSLTGPVTVDVTRGVSLSRLLLYGLITLLVCLPLIVLGCLIHNRAREEKSASDLAHERAVG
jgi:hypothetical protein